MHTSFGGEVKPSVPCRRFTACKRTLQPAIGPYPEHVLWSSHLHNKSKVCLILSFDLLHRFSKWCPEVCSWISVCVFSHATYTILLDLFILICVSNANLEAPHCVGLSIFAKECVAKCDKQQIFGTNGNRSKTIFMLKLMVVYIWEMLANFPFRSLSSSVLCKNLMTEIRKICNWP
jgi:hypothetical protein